MKTFDVVNHILKMADWGGGFSYEGVEILEDVFTITNEHYRGKGMIISFETNDDFSRENFTAVFSSDGNYLGTRCEPYFEDVNPNWNYDTKEI